MEKATTTINKQIQNGYTPCLFTIRQEDSHSIRH